MSDEPTQKLTWQADNTHPELVSVLKEALRTIMDPEIGLSVIELGLIRDVTIDEHEADLTMILTTPFCPYGPAIFHTTRLKAEEALGRTTHIQMGMEMWDFSMMEEGAAPEWGLY
jgi:metal-sulfur cluster biosynthetic enzyme